MAYKKLKLWFDEELGKLLADKIKPNHQGFRRSRFLRAIKGQIDPLELKDRVAVIAKAMHREFGEDARVGIEAILQSLGPENPEETGMFTNYYWVMPMAKYVEDYGLGHFELSTEAMKEITKRNTSEYAIRPFIRRFPDQTLDQMMLWAKDDNFHVRRLASEGGRPRLPWASKLEEFIKDPSPLIPLLEILKDDSSKYVQNSVANCLNDISKDNRDLAVSLVNSWLDKPTKSRIWIINHGTRGLRKVHDEWAMELYEWL